MQQTYTQENFEMILSISRNRVKNAENELRRELSAGEKRAIIASTIKRYLSELTEINELIERVLKSVR